MSQIAIIFVDDHGVYDAVPWTQDEPQPFTSIRDQTYLLNRTDVDLYDILVACFSLRAYDSHKILNLAMDGSIYQTGFTSSALAFRDFLIRAYKKNILPPGFDGEEMDRCVASARAALCRKVSEHSIRVTYARDDAVLMKLRCLAESIYGCAVGGNNMLDSMVALEKDQESAEGSHPVTR